MKMDETMAAARRPVRGLLLGVLLGVIVLVLVTMAAVGVYVSRSGDPLLNALSEEANPYPRYVPPEDTDSFEAEHSLPGENQPAAVWLAGAA
jgi:hypothetical protein